MAASLSTIAAKDGTGTTISGALQALDLSGAGTGPWSLANILVDGVSGSNRASVTASNALKVDGSAVTQPVSGTVTANAGTNLNTSALALETGGNLATLAGAISASRMNSNARITGNAGGIFDFVGQNATQPANAILIGGEFNTSPTTITSGNASPLQLDNAGNLKINVAAGGNSNGRKTPANSAPVVLASQTYAAVAASQTASVLGSTGAAGDWLDGFLVNPATTTPGNVTLLDGSSTIATFAFGTLADTRPFFVPVGAIAVTAWKVTTGANVSILAAGNFT